MPRKDRKLKLHKALKIGYLRDENKQAKALSRFGYMVDRRISDGRQTMVAYNPTENKVLFVENGTDTSSRKDIDTDLILGLGGLKQTTRYREAKEAYNAAKDKYKGAEFVSAGHSLGGGIVNSLIPRNSKDKGYSYNPAFAPNQSVNQNVQHYRTQGDLFSIFTPEKAATQLINTHQNETNIKNRILKTHNIDNIKNLPVFI